MPIILCRPKSLPLDRLQRAAEQAIALNPENALAERRVARTPIGRRGGPRRLAVVVGRKWRASGVRLSVQFLDNPSRELRKRIVRHMNAWNTSANVLFSETNGTGQVRIARLDSPEEDAGYWSYIGTEILEIDENEPTLNLEGFTMRTTDAEFRRVVRHEAGHTLGFEHEHMRGDLVAAIDREKAIAYYDRTDGWPPEEVEDQVLTPLDRKSITGTTESDPLSIMCYHIPAAITKNGKAIKGGKDINAKDFAFAATIYPKPGTRRTPEPAAAIASPSPAPLVATASPPSVGITTATNGDDVDTFHIVILDDFRPDGGPPDEKARPEFARVYASYAGARVTTAMRLNQGRNKVKTFMGDIIRTHERIRAYTNLEEGNLPDDAAMIGLGGKLFETLFQGDVRRLYDEARSRQRTTKLDLVLTSMIPWLAAKPWEFAYDTGRCTFLATEEMHFVRNVLTNVPADAIMPSSGPLTILVASAQPVGFGRLSETQETDVIRRGFDPLIKAGLATIETLPRATPESLHKALQTGAHRVVHFIGHGSFDEKKNEGYLIFESDRGGEFRLYERSARELFCNRGLQLVFLNACESGRGGRADFNKGVAQALVSHGLPALVANQYSVIDSSATSFAKHFYWSLGQGLSLGAAAREARIAVNYSLQGEPIDWAVPVLYARDPRQVLCRTPAAQTTAASQVSMHRTRVSPIEHRAVRVAVWDTDDVFPSLADTLRRMNAAQDVFGFELADLSLPLDVWDLETVPGKPYLWAEKLAARLEGKTVELRVDALACLTRQPLTDNDTYDIYASWPSKEKSKVVISSVAGFNQLAAEGEETNRVIANSVVTMLAGLFGDLDGHDRGPGSCPMFENAARDYCYVNNAQTFDPTCARAIRSKLGVEWLAALERLLKVFVPGSVTPRRRPQARRQRAGA